jgi:hypothetical protein
LALAVSGCECALVGGTASIRHTTATKRAAARVVIAAAAPL